MAASQQAEPALRAVIEPVVQGLGLDLEEIALIRTGRHGRLAVIVDQDGGVDLDAIAEASAAVSRALDANGDLGGDLGEVLGSAPYTLEVSSPGVDRPLTLPRHWRRNRGRLVDLTTVGGDVVAGRILEVDDTGVRIGPDTARMTDEPTDGGAQFLWEQIATGVIRLDFGRAREGGS